MRRGLVSFDALIALILLTFIVIWMQDFAMAGLDSADAFGTTLQLKATAVATGSMMNDFYTLGPGTGDYVTIRPGVVRQFGGGQSAITLVKGAAAAAVTASANATSQSYPVVGQLAYDAATGRYGP